MFWNLKTSRENGNRCHYLKVLFNYELGLFIDLFWPHLDILREIFLVFDDDYFFIAENGVNILKSVCREECYD